MAEVAGVHPRGGDGAGARHRRQLGHVQHRKCGAATADPVSAARTPSEGLQQHRAFQAILGLLSQLSRLAAAQPVVRRNGRVPHRQLQPHGPGESRAPARRNGVGDALRHARRPPDHRPDVHRRRRPARRRAGRGADVQPVEVAVRRLTGGAGREYHAQRQALHRDWRGARRRRRVPARFADRSDRTVGRAPVLGSRRGHGPARDRPPKAGPIAAAGAG